MKFLTYKYKESGIGEFVDFWSLFYDEGRYSDEVYGKNLNRKGLLNERNIKPLWEWKNGGPLSKSKQPVILRTVEKLDEINSFRKLLRVSKRDVRESSYIVPCGFVWKVFLFHIARPDDYPIFDQHVARAYHFLTTGEIHVEPELNMRRYYQYIKFFKMIKKKGNKDERQVDRALMAFGQHLKRYKKPIEIMLGRIER